MIWLIWGVPIIKHKYVGVWFYASFATLQRDFAILQLSHLYFTLIDGISVEKFNKSSALVLKNKAEIQRTRNSGGVGEGHGGIWGTLYTYNYTEVVF